jgi:hypothetical protein
LSRTVYPQVIKPPQRDWAGLLGSNKTWKFQTKI